MEQSPSPKPIELVFPVPKHPHLRCHVRLSILAKCATVYVTTSDLDMPSSQAPLGSFVYALPDRQENAISTALSTSVPNIDYATRLAKILARKFNQPVYVGCSINLAGVTVEEEMEGLREIVDKVVTAWAQTRQSRPVDGGQT
ncbi:hypothetical protein DV738_g2092, partial [Chaetothyriales sp. CBS 135597]